MKFNPILSNLHSLLGLSMFCAGVFINDPEAKIVGGMFVCTGAIIAAIEHARKPPQ